MSAEKVNQAQNTIHETISNLELSPNAEKSLWLIAAIAAICGGLYGYDTGIISGALLLITKEFSLEHQAQELVASAILAGAVVGALGTGWISERIGRRRAVMVVTAVFVVGAVACSISPNVEALIAARFLLGLAVGGSTQVVPMYISELAPAEQRGMMVTMFNVCIGIGILAANIVGFVLHDVWSWRTMVVIAAIPAGIVFLAMIVMPGSPRWAAENRGLEAAAKVLARVRSSRKQIRHELRQIHRVASETAPENKGWRGIGQPWVRPALIAALGVAFFTQCGGLEMMIYYAPTFLRDAGFGDNAALLASLGVGITYFTMTLLGCLFVDRIGRRRLVLIMTPGAILSMIGLGIMFALDIKTGFGPWLTIAFLLLFMVFNAGGIQVVGWLLGSEMFPLSMRGQATSLHAAMLWGSNLLVTGTALTLVNAISLGGTMWFYAGVNVLSFLFVYFLVPETAGASLEDIEDALQEGRFTPTRGRTAIVMEEDTEEEPARA